MKTILLSLTLILSLLSCGLFESSEKIPCPYEVKYGSHCPLIPVEIYPHKINYKVGDTIHISTNFRDSVFDFSTEQTFLMKNFPFDPGVKLWRFENDTIWENGLAVNEIIMDSFYYHRLDGNDDRVGVLYIDLVEKENMYFFEMKIVLKKAGRYILQFEDYIRRYTNELYDQRVDYYTFEGKCGMTIDPVAMIQGDDHLEEFETELLYIDKKLFYDNYRSLRYFDNSHNSPYGRGSMTWEFVGTYGFEVR
jgi:hypothetical protein